MTTNALQVIANPQISADFFPPMPAQRSPRQLWNDGYQSYIKREPLGEMQTEHERRGYLAAMRDCAYADGNAYLVKMGAAL